MHPHEIYQLGGSLVSAPQDGLVGAQDYAMGQVEANAALRARQLCNVLSGLGAAFVKIGQALSSRPDLLPQVYLEVGLQTLSLYNPLQTPCMMVVIARFCLAL